MERNATRFVSSILVLALFAAGAATAQVAPPPMIELCKPLEPPDVVLPSFVPWFYDGPTGEMMWGRHIHWEDQAHTVFSLARELVEAPDQPAGSHPEALLFNFAQFYPPEGIDVPGVERMLMLHSIYGKGLQLYVNYSGATIDPAQPSVNYFNPTFFLSLDAPKTNQQTTPPVVASGLSSQLVSATRGAFGCLFRQVPAHTVGGCDDLYVTAGIGYGLADLDPDPAQQSLAQQAWTDRLLHRDTTTGVWSELAQDTCPSGVRVPASASAGNSSGVVFADLDGDGFSDLYVGKPGDNYLGAANVLLINDGTGCFSDQTATRILSAPPVKATNDVAAVDLENDGDLDLVVANRCQRDAACGVESEDYVLVNDGNGNFSVGWLNTGLLTDTRSVATGDLDQDGWPELVLGNAGSDGFENDLLYSVALDHPMQIFFNDGASGGTVNQFTDQVLNVLKDALTERLVTTPQTLQVLVTDMFGPATAAEPLQPDGMPDLVIVNGRDILKNVFPVWGGSSITVLVNRDNWSDPTTTDRFATFAFFHTGWSRTAAVADFTDTGFPDILDGRGNRFSGVLSEIFKNKGPDPSGSPWDFSGGFIGNKSYESFPGTEHGYGLDVADVDADAVLDGLQTSRGYDYFVRSIGAGAWHQELADPALGTGMTSNARGRLIPRGMEDGIFADFDRDGDLDAILASQRIPSTNQTTRSPDTIVFVNSGNGTFGYDFVPHPTSPGDVEDARIDLNGRTATPLPPIGDRVVAGDLDNDGDVDAIVHLFQLPGPTSATPLLTTANGFPPPLSQYSAGWRYLENVVGEPGAGSFFFRDVAATRMRNSAGAFDTSWNRNLGMDLLADFDNNGCLDFYTTNGFAKQAGEVESVTQTYDLLFMNSINGNGIGVLEEASAAFLPPPCVDGLVDGVNFISCGSFGIAQGDVDNDGDADVFVNHYGQQARPNYPWLLINKLDDPLSPRFDDEHASRVLANTTFSTLIHNDAPADMDYAMFPAFLDFDADGDLDLLYQNVRDYPRLFENDGVDTNGDGLINGQDASPPGTFTDVTDAVLGQRKPTVDSQDILVVDIDGDGDLDFLNDPFNGMVAIWRNNLPAIEERPAVTEAWPRVGAVKGTTIRLHGIHLTRVLEVEFRFAGGVVCKQTSVTPVAGSGGTRLDVVIPASCPDGLAQVRVLRNVRNCDNVTEWSRQYFGYFVLKAPPPPPPPPPTCDEEAEVGEPCSADADCCSGRCVGEAEVMTCHAEETAS